jgi:hypothetical protein
MEMDSFSEARMANMTRFYRILENDQESIRAARIDGKPPREAWSDTKAWRSTDFLNTKGEPR